ncbi:MAG: glucosamine-6-phosphate deaminase [Bacteroidaceae bacterium]|nr:glucosamine-6-phosphate deaminase [Bacteroidaceae bacterium]
MKSKYSLPKEGGLIASAVPEDIICRFEKIPTHVFPSEYEGVQHVADKIIRAIADHEAAGTGRPFVLGLTTGHTPLGLYRELVTLHKAGKVSFRNVEVYSLDEFYPITPEHQQSRNYRIHAEFLNHIDILPENIHIPDGTVPLDQISEYCRRYGHEAKNKMDLMIIGVGEQGQLGFNEPGTFFRSKTRLVQLSYNSIKTQSGFFSSIAEVPKMAITMGIDTIMKAKQIVLMAWGEDKADVIRKIVEGDVSEQTPASILQEHPEIEVVIDETAAAGLTRYEAPWVVGPCEWSRKLIRKAVIWLCARVEKPILKLTFQDYLQNSLAPMLDTLGKPYTMVNIEVFNDLQHTISGWPGGKPNADDATRPVKSVPYPKRVLIFSPHPDDDVISMGGTFCRLIQQGHDVHVAYETSGNVAVYDDVVIQNLDTAREMGLGDRVDEIRAIINSKVPGQPEPRALLNIKGAIRRAEARAADRSIGLDDRTNVHFLNLPFYESGTIKKGELGDADIDIIVCLLRQLQPHQIYAAGDLSDPHGTHRVCIEAVLGALDVVKDDPWMAECHLWLYRGAWQEWPLDQVDMAVPISPEELIKKRQAIFRHLSQKDIVPFPGEDQREFWQRAEERTQHTAHLYNLLGLPEYQAIEVFLRMR